MALPLKGIRILDLSWTLPGPFCTMLLADLGAEVIKIEQPGTGDYARELVPGLFEVANRNKKSITLNLKSQEGKKIFYELVTTATVVVESFKPGVVKRLQVDYETLKQLKPNIIYGSLSGYGQNGPYRDLPGHDTNYVGVAGGLNIPSVMEHPPIRPSFPVADLSSALFLTISLLAAIAARNESGQGQYIDVSATDCVLSLASARFGDFLLTGVLKRHEEMLHLFAANNQFTTKDGKPLTVALVEDAFWNNFSKIVDITALSDTKFSTAAGRRLHAKELLVELKLLFKTKTRTEWAALFEGKNIPWALVNNYQEALEDPQINDRRMVREIKYRGKNLKLIKFPAIFSDFDFNEPTPPPELGENTNSVLAGLGYSHEEIENLRSIKVI